MVLLDYAIYGAVFVLFIVQDDSTDLRYVNYTVEHFELTLPKDFEPIDELALKYGLNFRSNEYNGVTITDKNGMEHVYSADMPNIRSYNGRLYVSESAFKCAVKEDPKSKARRGVKWIVNIITGDYQTAGSAMDKLQDINNQNPFNNPLWPGYDPNKPSGTITH